jgi:HKD family nuclease
MKIEFIGAPFENIDGIIPKLLKTSNRVSIAVAFLQKSGVEKLKNYLGECNENGTSISVITGLNYSFTNPKALEELLNLDISCNIFQDENFHPKLYIFEKNETDVTVIVGSSNLSEGGLSTNYEANVILKGNVTESPIKNAIEYFSHLESKSIPLDETIIDLYSKTKEIKDNINSTIDDEYEELRAELTDYLNQKISSIELTSEEVVTLFINAESNSNNGLDCYERGEMIEAYNLFKESCSIYDELSNAFVLIDNKLISIEKIENKDCSIEKVSSLINMAWVLYQLHKSDEAKNCTDEAEVISKSKGNNKYLLEAIGLGAIIRGLSKEANEKCDEFIKIYESNKDILENEDDYLIGNVYSSSAECKWEFKINHGNAYKHSLNAIQYFSKSIEHSDSKFATMIAYLNIAIAYHINNEIKPEPDFDCIEIKNIYEKALSIAEDELNSKFWEASVRMDIGESYCSSKMESCFYLKRAKKIFEGLEYYDLINSVDELIEYYGCS